MRSETASVAVVIPSFKVRRQILGVIAGIGPICSHIYVVDDGCPQATGRAVQAQCTDPRVTVIFNEINLGVGGAVMAGYRRAVEDGADVVVKIDGDGQMDPALLPDFVGPLLAGEADYSKGNRFYNIEGLARMPRARLFGNAVLSLLAKISTGYWHTFDPTNGFTAIQAEIVRLLPLEKISKRYFFETDILFRLNALRAVVVDIPMEARYGEEVSNLRISRIVGEFLVKHLQNFVKRVFYNYYLRDMSLASLELPIGIGLLAFGAGFGAYHWLRSASLETATPLGTIMLAALSLLSGLQFVMAFFAYDIASVPRQPLILLLKSRRGVQRKAMP